MSFSSDTKSELCGIKYDRKCCALAECYGVLLYCNTFSPREIRIITASESFAQRLPKIFKKAFGFGFDKLPTPGGSGKKSLIINDSEKIRKIYDSYGAEYENTLSHHLNFGVLEEDCCRISFVRGAFLAGGSVTDPEKRFHLELATGHHSVSRELYSLLLELGFEPKETQRGGNSLLYFKKSVEIERLLATIGATNASMEVATAVIEKEMRNSVTRQINCDSANTDKTVAASQAQIDAIHAYARAYGLESLPEVLYDAALLRITNPEASLSDLARLSMPPVSKSCLSHRLKKIISLAPKE